ncbi:MAG: integrase domain-containing protein [Pseudomonadota bacterium]
MNKPGGSKNYGYGRKLEYAVHNALLDKFGDGRFSTRHTYESRIQQFLNFMRRETVRDLRRVTRDVITGYTENLQAEIGAESLTATTAVHRLSAVNVLMSHVRQDNALLVSPSKTIARRRHVRESAPIGLCVTDFNDLFVDLNRPYEREMTITLALCRFAGMRFREASLTPLADTLSELLENAACNVVHGTKGGRRVHRPVPASPALLHTLEYAVATIDRTNIIPPAFNYARWQSFAYRNMPAYAGALNISQGFHDLRAAYACERYLALTGHDAPVVAGERLAPKAADREARDMLSVELGHSRRQIASSYVGTSR